jgi:hypothetical protein
MGNFANASTLLKGGGCRADEVGGGLFKGGVWQNGQKAPFSKGVSDEV